MNCPFCAAENGTTASYCSSCGSPLHLRVCPHCEGVSEKTATACISCGGALVAEPEVLAGPAVATRTRIAARPGVMDDNVIDVEATGLTWASNGRRESAWPVNVRPENILQQDDPGASSADLEMLLGHIDEEIHRLDAHARSVPAVAPRAAPQMFGPSEESMAASPAVATRIAARPGVMDDNVIDWEATDLSWANNGRRESAWPVNIRPKNIWQQDDPGASSADLEMLLGHIDEEIHRLDARARSVRAVAPRAAPQMPGPSKEPMAAAPEPIPRHPPLAANDGVVETQQFGWRGPVLLLVSAVFGISSYLSLPPEPSSMLVGSVAWIGRGISEAPPTSDAMAANALASPPATVDKAIAAIPAVVPKAWANSPAWPDDPRVDPLGELIAAKLQAETAPPEASAVPRPAKAGNGLEAPSVPDTGNAPASQARPGAITAVSDIPIRAGSGQPKPIRASSDTSRRNAMLRASKQTELEPVRRHLY